MLYRASTGIAWRDLPERFGAWKTIYNKFARWSHFGHWKRIFKALQLRVDEDGVIIDSSIVRSPPGYCGRKMGLQSNALGRSRGGFSTKIHALVDAKGRPLHIEITPGQQPESTTAQARLREHARDSKVLADTAYDSDAIRACVEQLGMKPVIHPHPIRKRKPPLDRVAYSTRYRVE